MTHSHTLPMLPTKPACGVLKNASRRKGKIPEAICFFAKWLARSVTVNNEIAVIRSDTKRKEEGGINWDIWDIATRARPLECQRKAIFD